MRHRILIANRGEIAVRILRACERLGHEAVCVATAADHASMHARLALETFGPDALYRISSYQDPNELFAVADHAGATAVHPGYGFLAEDFRFARRVANRDRPLVFIGPSWWLVRDLGDKINTKRLARRLGVPTIPGSDRPVTDELEAEQLARDLFLFQEEQGVQLGAVLVKASAGGGGMGIEEVGDLDEFRSVFRRIRNYAKRQFGDDGVLIEQRLYDFNHLEVQVVADRSGIGPVHFGTRNCSIQSTGRQKRVEVAPGFAPEEIAYPFDAAALLEEITVHSLNMARESGYDNLGTWEWIVTPAGEPFLMEVNTRIQVENGVSAAIATVHGEPVDLVREQIRLGLGEPLGYTQEDVALHGVAVEYRIIAERPEDRFAPCTGEVQRFEWTARPWLAVHTHVPQNGGYAIPTDFDPNLALGIVTGASVAEAAERGREFLSSLTLTGRDEKGLPLSTNLDYLLDRTGGMLRV